MLFLVEIVWKLLLESPKVCISNRKKANKLITIKKHPIGNEIGDDLKRDFYCKVNNRK